MGWEMHNEDPPNQIVHAEDLAAALARLHADHHEDFLPVDDINSQFSTVGRRRTGSSTIVYHPDDHGDSPDLPAIAVEDTTASPVIMTPTDEMEGVEGPIAQQKAQGKFVSTSRPPVELMH